MLRCQECDAVADDDASGWTAFRFEDPDDGGSVVVVYCPACAKREFGEAPASRPP